MAAVFAVGIDLGTTNTVVAAGRLDGADAAITFDMPQLVSASEVEARPLLPSMLYAPAEGERIEDPFGDAPWAIGEIARRRSPEAPGRVVASSKSWLVHPSADRGAPILPWGGAEDAPKVSPVDAAARLLAHVRRVWDEAHPRAQLAEQEVVLTVPASFDEVAREMSVEAARRAGLSPKLLEEPQAAFYDWMGRVGGAGLRRLVEVREGAQGAREARAALVLVVDVGGGTTDLSLVRVSGPEDVARIAVGPHVLLGGDNMDIALAHACEARLTGDGSRLDAARFAQLVGACRAAKERLLGGHDASSPALDGGPVTVLATGASLVGAARTTRLERDEVERIVLEGFFPAVAAGARPQRARGALVEFGLPYERDAAITRHVAAFLAAHRPEGARLDAVLLNGGVFRAVRIAERVMQVIASWNDADAPLLRLPDADPDLAVARGAVAYARARSGRGVRIGGGIARGFFVGIAPDRRGAPPQAVCVVPRGAEEGVAHVAGERTFALAVGRPARFELFASDAVDVPPGAIVDVDEDRFVRLPPVATTLESATPGRTEVRVALEGELTPVGTVDLGCIEVDADPPRRFRLAFAMRGETAKPSTLPPASRRQQAAGDLLERVFGKPRPDASGREVRDLVRDLERLLGERAQWTTETNRALFDALVPNLRARRRSADHERVFWLLAGWCVRPGFGDALDGQRVTALMRVFDERLAFPNEARGWQQFWVAWRRAAGGLDEAAQMRIRDFVDPYLAPAGAGSKRPKKPALSLDDALDMASALERLPPPRRSELGGWVLERTWTDRDPRLWAAIGRLGARVPSYASVHHVVSPMIAERWVDHLLREKWESVPTAVGAAVQLARRTGDRVRDVSDRVRLDVEKRLVAAGAKTEHVQAVREVVPVGESERATFFGDALPLGLRLIE
jgi:molecular chaperone DnaK (HSP70)